MMDLIATICIYGLSYGFILFIASVGLSIALGMLGIVNAAHGALLMLGGYIGISVLKFTGSWLLGLFAAALSCGLISLGINEVFLRRLHRQQLQQILVTFGWVYVLGNVVLWIWGAQTRVADEPALLAGNIPLYNVLLPVDRLVAIIIGIVVFVMLWLVQEKTKIGSIIRAGMEDSEMISALGYNLRPRTVGAFGLGLALAGLASFLGSPVLGGMSAWMGPRMFFLCMVVVIVGGVGSVQGTLAGALLIGILYVTVATFFPPFAIVATYIAMVIVLLFRPQGLLGRAW
jgi:branched-chain amino acid transport system permease protein